MNPRTYLVWDPEDGDQDGAARIEAIGPVDAAVAWAHKHDDEAVMLNGHALAVTVRDPDGREFTVTLRGELVAHYWGETT